MGTGGIPSEVAEHEPYACVCDCEADLAAVGIGELIAES